MQYLAAEGNNFPATNCPAACICGDSEDDPCDVCRDAMDRADRAARDRSAAVEYGFYEGLAEVVGGCN